MAKRLSSTMKSRSWPIEGSRFLCASAKGGLKPVERQAAEPKRGQSECLSGRQQFGRRKGRHSSQSAALMSAL